YHGKPHGVCRRNPPVNGEFSEVHGDSMCGEWADKTITPEQAERSELVRQFAVAIVQGMYANPEERDVNVILLARRFADRLIESIQDGQT
ncbi:MAG: hypothetical protein ACK6EB_34345, partial [Planctomyces sp.]